ncbi:MAG TPA: biotin/lipoate A/B protein ligase family protein, partial [Solirubrobacteraceae bacterium]|nr:biotin/lipoate A/B protein ligase family protein [Solirubrobacteraceae bacterium]
MTRWRLITDDGAGAGDGLAADEALMLHHRRGGDPAYPASLRLYTYRSHCALVGRYQLLEAEVDLDACARHGVEVGRRPTGGGAIIMGEDQLGVAITTQAPADCRPRDLLCAYADALIAGLAQLGVQAGFRGKNDLEVDGRKIAGLGLYVDDHGALLFHASVLAGLDVDLMLSVLRIPGAKLADKGVARVAERITTVSEQIGTPVNGAALRRAMTHGVAEALDVELEDSELTEAERSCARELIAQRYGSPAWLAGRSGGGDARATAPLKTPGGLVRVYAGVQNEAISSVMFSGDFSAMPPGLLALEAALRWCRAAPERIGEIVAAQLPDGELGVAAEALAGAVWAAAERAL